MSARIGKKISTTKLPMTKILLSELYATAARAPMTKDEFKVKMAQDSMRMMETVLYNPLIPARDPVAARMVLPCRESWTTIIMVRRTLSETESERY